MSSNAVRKPGQERLAAAGYPLLSILAALLVGALLVALDGHNPINAYASLFRGAFGSFFNITETLVQTTPLIFTGLAVAFAFTCGMFNIGAEGQLLVGALAATALGVYVRGVPPFLHVTICLLGAGIAGAVWASLPAALKVLRGAHEVISSIMMNWIAIYAVHFLVVGVMKAPGEIPATLPIQESAYLPSLFGVSYRISSGFALALVLSVALFLVINWSVFGYEVRSVGLNRFASKYAGMKVLRTAFLSFLVSGMFAGIAGAVEIVGLHGKFYDGFSPGYGFTGIAIALLARKNPLVVILAALFFGALRNGATEMQIVAGVPKQIVDTVQGLVVVFVAGEGLLRDVLSRRQG